MHTDDLLYSLRSADCDEARDLLSRLDAADLALRSIPSGRPDALAAGIAGAARNKIKRESAKIVEARGWFRRLPSDGYDGSYVGHEDR